MKTPKLDKDVSPDKLARELGLTVEEALELRKNVEFVRTSSVQRIEWGPPIQLRKER